MNNGKQFFFENIGVSFNLRNPKSNHPQIVYFVVRLNNKQYKLTTNVKVLPCQWDEKEQIAKLSPRYSKLDLQNNQIVNDRLFKVMEYFSEFKDYICNNPEKLDTAGEIIRKYIYKDIPEMEKKKNQNISATSTLQLLLNKSTMADSSKLQHTRNLGKFTRFLKEKNIPDNFDSMNLVTFNLYKERLVEEKLKPNSINGIITRSLFGLLKKANKNIDIPFKWSESNLDCFEPVKDKSNKELSENKQVALTDEELKNFYNFQISKENLGKGNRIADKNISKYIIIRDMFVLQCYTSQRIGDFERIMNGDIKIDEDTQTFSIVQEKTTTKATIPLFPITLELFNKYKNKDVSVYFQYSGTTNRILKEIAKAAGLDRPVTYQENGVDKTSPLYELIHTHTARHTFITLMCRQGVNKEDLRLITGHKSTAMIDNVYSHLTAEDNAKKVVTELTKKGIMDSFGGGETKVCPKKKSTYDQLIDELAQNNLQIGALTERNKEIVDYLKHHKSNIQLSAVKAIAKFIASQLKDRIPSRVIIKGLATKFNIR